MDHIPFIAKIWFQFTNADHTIQDKERWNCAESLLSWRAREVVPRYQKNLDKLVTIIRHFKEILPSFKKALMSEQKMMSFRRGTLSCINMFLNNGEEMFWNGHFHTYGLNLWNSTQETFQNVYVFSWFRMKLNFCILFSLSPYGLYQIYINTRLHL